MTEINPNRYSKRGNFFALYQREGQNALSSGIAPSGDSAVPVNTIFLSLHHSLLCVASFSTAAGWDFPWGMEHGFQAGSDLQHSSLVIRKERWFFSLIFHLDKPKEGFWTQAYAWSGHCGRENVISYPTWLLFWPLGQVCAGCRRGRELGKDCWVDVTIRHTRSPVSCFVMLHTSILFTFSLYRAILYLEQKPAPHIF